MAPTTRVDSWLRRLPLLGVAVLLCLACYLLWRMSMVLYRIEESVVAVSADLQSVTRSASNIAQRVDELVQRTARLEEKAERAAGVDDLEAALDSLAEVRREKQDGPVTLPPQSEKEIKRLLACIRSSGLEFVSAGRVRSAYQFYLHLYAKYVYYKKTVGSAEDFIAKVATESIAGHPYHVMQKDGTRVELKTWLSEELKRAREPGPLDKEDGRVRAP
ncbi:MAG: DUF5329 family protein [Planctomycetota bacterium]|nr:DUF5329 family protein [Planctomycetota bacterium]